MSGIIRGIIFGAVSVAVMLPMSFPSKLAAFLNRFARRAITFESAGAENVLTGRQFFRGFFAAHTAERRVDYDDKSQSLGFMITRNDLAIDLTTDWLTF